LARKVKPSFDPEVFLAAANGGRTIFMYKNDGAVFEQGEPADAVFYIQKGNVKLVVRSEQGKEAVVGILGPRDFLGEGCLIGQPLYLATALAVTESSIMRLDKPAMVRVLHEEPSFAERFLTYMPHAQQSH
jgi:CRP/FNR family cyclic AMP-dependent transcriptional regulator